MAGSGLNNTTRQLANNPQNSSANPRQAEETSSLSSDVNGKKWTVQTNGRNQASANPPMTPAAPIEFASKPRAGLARISMVCMAAGRFRKKIWAAEAAQIFREAKISSGRFAERTG